MNPTVELDPGAVVSSAVDRLRRFAHLEALEIVRHAAREPRAARHFQRLDPFGSEQGRDEFGRAVLGFALWLGERLGAVEARGGRAVARLRHALGGLEDEVARYGRVAERYALERFSHRAVETLDLEEKDLWAGRMLILSTLAEPIREHVERALRELSAVDRGPQPEPA